MKAYNRHISSSIRSAARRLAIYRREDKDRLWHMGITSSSIVMLDLDTTQETLAIETAIILKKFIESDMGIENKVIVIKTNRGYHIVSDAILKKSDWEKVYKLFIELAKDGYIPLDILHAELSLKYSKTTLRISPQGDDIYEVVKIV